MNDIQDDQTNTENTEKYSVEDPRAGKAESRVQKGLKTARRATVNTVADTLGYGLGVANVGAMGAVQAVKGTGKLFMIPLKHAYALGYTGFSAFVVGTGFAFKTIGKGLGFGAGKTWSAAKWTYRPFSPYVNKAARAVLPPIGRGAVAGAKGVLAGINAVSPIVTVPVRWAYKGVQVVGKGAGIALSPIHNFGKRHFPKMTEKTENLVKLIGEHRPVDAIAYPLAGLYMGVRGLYKVVYGILDVSARFVGRRIYNNFPKTSQNILDGYNIARDTLRDTIQNLPPEKAFALVAVMSALAYAISPVMGGYYTIYATSEAVRSSAIIIPKILKVTAGTTTYLCWDQAKQSKGFEKVKKVYDPFADAVGWIRNKVDAVDNFFEKHLTVYAATKKAISGTKEGQAKPKKYKAKLAKLGSKIIPGYRRADEHQEWMTDYVTNTRAYKVGERGFHASVNGLQSAWNAVAPYHKKILDTGSSVLPDMGIEFNKAAGFKARMVKRRQAVVKKAENAASSLGRVFGVSKVTASEEMQEDTAPSLQEKATSKQPDNPEPR